MPPVVLEALVRALVTSLGPLCATRATTWLWGHHTVPGLGSSFPRWLHGAAAVVGRCFLPFP